MLASAGPMGTSSFGYDADGRMTSRADASGTATFTWKNHGQLATTTDPLTGQTRTYTYTAAGQVDHIKFGTGQADRDFAYDNLGRLTADNLLDGTGATIWQTAYGYDDSDNITSEVVTGPGVAGAGTHTYSYDRADRIDDWTAPGGAVTNYELR